VAIHHPRRIAGHAYDANQGRGITDPSINVVGVTVGEGSISHLDRAGVVAQTTLA